MNLSFHNLYKVEEKGIFIELDLNVTSKHFQSFEVVFSHDVNAVLLDDKVFLNLRQEPRLQPLSHSLALTTLNEPPTDETICWKKTPEICTSSCGRYVAVSQRIELQTGMTLRLDLFDVQSASVSCQHHELVKNLLRQCIGLQIDFHPCLPKLAMMSWDETDKPNKLSKPCERVRCIIWDLDTDRVSTIGEILDFSTSFGE